MQLEVLSPATGDGGWSSEMFAKPNDGSALSVGRRPSCTMELSDPR